MATAEAFVNLQRRFIHYISIKKYNNDKSVSDDIVSATSRFINSRNWRIDLIIPVPPSRKRRGVQPVLSLAKGIGKVLAIDICADAVVKVKDTPELKDVFDFEKRLAILKDAFEIRNPAIAGRRVMLFDDLYRSGATLNAVSGLLRREGKVKNVYALTLTMTRSIR